MFVKVGEGVVIANCRLPIAKLARAKNTNRQSAIGDRQ
jgi:hypothetical protein